MATSLYLSCAVTKALLDHFLIRSSVSQASPSLCLRRLYQGLQNALIAILMDLVKGYSYKCRLVTLGWTGRNKHLRKLVISVLKFRASCTVYVQGMEACLGNRFIAYAPYSNRTSRQQDIASLSILTRARV